MSQTNKKSEVLVALDVGTTKVCTIIATLKDEQLEILGVGSHPSHGLKKGCVINIDKTVRSIRCSLEEAKLMSGLQEVNKATIGIAGSHIYSFNSSGAVAIKGKEVTEEDIKAVMDAAKAVVIPSDREILHILPQEFRVDNTRGIKDPIGMYGVRLEGNVHIVTGQTTLIQNLVRCVEQAGVQPENILLQPVASSSSVLNKEEKELGAVLVDIGGGTTDLAIWKDGCLLHTQIIPVGGSHFTNDLAVALKVSHSEAERIKINHGSIIPEKVNQSSLITIQGVGSIKSREVELKHVSKVLSSRAEELFMIIRKIIADRGLTDKLSAGFIFTGGGAMIKDLIPLAEYVLEKPVKVGYPVSFGGMTNIMQDPKLSTVLGLLIESKGSGEMVELAKTTEEQETLPVQGDIISRFSKSLKNVFKEIF